MPMNKSFGQSTWQDYTVVFQRFQRPAERLGISKIQLRTGKANDRVLFRIVLQRSDAESDCCSDHDEAWADVGIKWNIHAR
jgi:hypothetical protein